MERGLPVVATSELDPANHLPTIGHDNRALGRVALDHLVTLGHRRITVLHGPVADNDRSLMRLDGVRDAAAGLDLRLIETTLDASGGAAAARQALEPRVRPRALLCLSDVLALGALFEARRAQLDVPQQLSVLGFDDVDWAAVCDPPLSTLHLPTELMGRLAAQALVQRLDHGLPIRALKLETGFVGRASTAPPWARTRR